VQLDSQVNRGAIVGLYKEIDNLKSQFESLKTAIQGATAANKPSQSLKKDETSQSEASGKLPPTRSARGFSEEAIKTQRESLRKTTPSQVQ